MGWLECGQPSGPAAGHKAKLTMPTTGDRVAASSLASKIPVEVFVYFGIWKLFLFLLCFCFVLFSLFFLIVAMVIPVDETRPGEQGSEQSMLWFCLPASTTSLAFLFPFLGTMSSVAASPKTRTRKDPVLPSVVPHSQIAYSVAHLRWDVHSSWTAFCLCSLSLAHQTSEPIYRIQIPH